MKTLVAAFALLASSSAYAATIAHDVEQRIATTGHAHVVVTLREEAVASKGAADRASRIAATRASVLAHISADQLAVTDTWSSVAGFAGELTASGIEALAANPLVDRVELDESGGGALNESLPLIGANVVHAMSHTGKGVPVAILDSGIDSTHPDFAGRITAEACFCRNADGTGCCPNAQTSQFGAGAARDDHGHGTHVAGIAGGAGGAAPVGVAPGVTFVIVKVLDSQNRFSASSQVISGLDWLAQNHPEVRAVNMSLLTTAHYGGACDDVATFTQSFAQVIGLLRSHGTAVFACSGNTGSPNSMGAPACVSNAISVGAVYDSSFGPYNGSCSDTTAADVVTCFSDSDPTLDLLAPGSSIRSTARGGGSTLMSGTSMASPHAMGTAALLLGIKPSLTVDAIEAILQSTGKKLVDKKNGITTPRIDALAAVQSVLRSPAARRRAAGKYARRAATGMVRIEQPGPGRDSALRTQDSGLK